MLDTIIYGDAGPVSCAGSFEGLATITAANAAQVAQIRTYGDASEPVYGVAFSPDGKQLAAGTADGSAWLWSMVTGELQLEFPRHRDGATAIAFSGIYNFVVGSGNGRVWLYDSTFGESSGSKMEHSEPVESIATSPDNGFVIVSGATDGSVRVYSLLDGSERTPLVDENSVPVTSVAYSSDGTTVAAGGGSTIRLWNVETGAVLAELQTEISDITSIAFSPDGTRLIYGGADPAVWVWNLADDHHALLEGHDPQVFALAFSPDGSMIASGDASTVRLWDAATGAELATLTSPTEESVNSLAFSPDGTLVASGGDAGGVILWGTSVGGGSSQETAASEATTTDEETTASAEETSTTTEETTTETTTAVAACAITASNQVNLRSGPGTEFERAGTISAGQSVNADGQAQGADGMTWYRLTDGTWVRSDVVGSPADCAALPPVS